MSAAGSGGCGRSAGWDSCCCWLAWSRSSSQCSTALRFFRCWRPDSQGFETVARNGKAQTMGKYTKELEKLVRVDNSVVRLNQSIYPAQEVALKPGRLDPRLVAFQDFGPQAIAPYNRLVVSLIATASTQNLQRVL